MATKRTVKEEEQQQVGTEEVVAEQAVETVEETVEKTVFYIGPSIAKFGLQQNTRYSNLTETMEQARQLYPSLFVSDAQISEAADRVFVVGSQEHADYQKLKEVK